MSYIAHLVIDVGRDLDPRREAGPGKEEKEIEGDNDRESKD